MIGFTLSDEQLEFQKVAHDFAENEMRPVAAECDEEEKIPWEVLRQAHEIGLMTFWIPEEYGGVGVDHLTQRLVQEELFWGCAGIATTMGANDLAGTPILLGGSEAQKEKYLGWLCEEGRERPVMGAYALTAAGAGSDPASLRTTAAKQADGSYLLNGTKLFITNGGIADFYTVFATIEPSLGLKGITAFIVEREWEGVSIGSTEHKMGIRSSNTSEVIFNNVRVPPENRLGREGEGFRLAMITFDNSRSMIAVGAVGLARAAFEYARDYALERVQFGKPIAYNQAIAFMLADMAMEIDAARLLCWRAACLLDEGKPCPLEASMSKAYAADMCMRVTTDAVQILGGYGYTREYTVEKWMRDD